MQHKGDLMMRSEVMRMSQDDLWQGLADKLMEFDLIQHCCVCHKVSIQGTTWFDLPQKYQAQLYEKNKLTSGFCSKCAPAEMAKMRAEIDKLQEQERN